MAEKPIQVLLIEDDSDDAALIEHFLAGAQAQAHEASFALKSADRLSLGCKLLTQGPFDVVLLDLMLPGGTGIEAFAQVRETRPEIPVVVLTGLKDEALATRAVSLGAQDYLIKGTIDARVLKRAIRYAIERGRLLARVESILNRDLDGKLIVDSRGIIRFLNPAAEAIFGRKQRDLLDKPLPFDRPPRLPADVRLTPPAFEERILDLRAVELEWGGERAELVTLRDVTELRRVEQLRAEIKERMLAVDLKNEFMTTISHELRNPLTTVKTAIQSLRDGLVGPLTPQQMRFIDLAHRNVERQIRIINNVLDLARFQSGKVKLEFRRLNIATIVEETLQSYAIASGGPRVEFAPAPDLPEVWADADLVIQVLTNLLDNALRYAREKVVVRLSSHKTERGSRGALLSVIDDGPGMAESQAAKIFSKFVQVTRAPGAGYKGTGLGLAICKEILAGHGGRIWVESVSGKGARFNALWPAFVPTARGAAAGLSQGADNEFTAAQ